MQILSTESSWTDATTTNNKSALSPAATVNQSARLRSKVLTMCKMESMIREFQLLHRYEQQ